jgi:hypothetical protein
MNPRLGACIIAACAVVALFAAGCNNNTSTAVTVTPTPVTTGPDTLYVQDGGTKTVRAYAHASNLNGLAFPSAVYPTSDTSNPDIIYDTPHNLLWFPSAYPSQTYTGAQSTPIRIWTAASTKNAQNPDVLTAFTDGAGTAAYDAVHDLLFVANVVNPALAVYSNAHLMTNASLPAATVTLNITDPGVVGPPRAQDMYYDALHDRLFVSDEGSVVAVFDSFGSTALAGGVRASNRQMTGLFSPDGLAYSPVNDVLYIGEITRRQIDVIHNAGTFNGPTGHVQVINAFATGPTGMAYDAVHDFLFVYDPLQIWMIPAPAVATGNVNNITNRHQFFDATTELVGFGLSVDTVH